MLSGVRMGVVAVGLAAVLAACTGGSPEATDGGGLPSPATAAPTAPAGLDPEVTGRDLTERVSGVVGLTGQGSQQPCAAATARSLSETEQADIPHVQGLSACDSRAFVLRTNQVTGIDQTLREWSDAGMDTALHSLEVTDTAGACTQSTSGLTCVVVVLGTPRSDP